MAMRLLLTTAIGLALGTAAFAQPAADPSKTAPNNAPAAQAAPANTPTAAAQPASVALSAGVSVTEPDRDRISESVARMSVKPLRGVDFSVSVGSHVPRELRVYRLPADVVQIVPQYRDYRFLVVDKQILIVEPQANKIVTILPRDPTITTATTAAPTPPPATAAPVVVAPVAAAPTAVAPVAAAPVAMAPVVAAPVVAAPTTAAPTTPAPAASTSTTSTTPASTAAAPATPSTPGAARASTENSQTAAEPNRAKVKKQASRSQRMRQATRDEARRASAEVRVGQRVPDNVQLYDLPPRMYREVPATREYRYRSYANGSRGRAVYQEFD